MPITTEQIAFHLVLARFRKDGIRLSKTTKEEITKQAEELGIPAGELLSFYGKFVRDLVEETFPKPPEKPGGKSAFENQ